MPRSYLVGSDLLSKGKDPLEEVLQQSNSTTTRKSPVKSKRKNLLDPPDEGKSLQVSEDQSCFLGRLTLVPEQWDTDDESDEAIKLATPKSDYRPKDFTNQDSTPQKRKADAAGKGYIRWTAEEEETLRKGIERS